MRYPSFAKWYFLLGTEQSQLFNHNFQGNDPGCPDNFEVGKNYFYRPVGDSGPISSDSE